MGYWLGGIFGRGMLLGDRKWRFFVPFGEGDGVLMYGFGMV